MRLRKTNRLLALGLCLCLLLSVLPISGITLAAEQGSSQQKGADTWDGTADVSWYQDGMTEFHLQTAEQLAGLAELVNAGNSFKGKTVYLDNDLDLGGYNWVSIGNEVNSQDKYFKGVFDGQRHLIKNLTKTDSGDYYNGLFGLIEVATIQNLGVVEAHISFSNASRYLWSGILVDSAIDARISDCFTTGEITGNTAGNHIIGGIVGKAWGDTKIVGCYSSAVLTSKATDGADAVGGIAGVWEVTGYGSALIADCYFDGGIRFSGGGTADTGMATNVGGILGICFEETAYVKIKNCMVATQSVQAPSDYDINNGAGGIWIAWYLFYGVPENCYWPQDDRNWPAAIEVQKITDGDAEGALHFDCGTPTADFKADSVLQGLQTNAQTGVEWVMGFEHPTFAWNLSGIPADYTAVEAAKSKVPGDLSLYTPATVDALNQALNQVAAGKSKAEQAEVDAMAKAIEDAIAGLKQLPVDADPVNPPAPDKPTDTGKDMIIVTPSPKTGDADSPWLWALLALAALIGCGVLAVYRKKSKEA